MQDIPIHQASERLTQLLGFRKAKKSVINLLSIELAEIDLEIVVLLKKYPNLDRYRYPDWLKEDIEEFEQRHLAGK